MFSFIHLRLQKNNLIGLRKSCDPLLRRRGNAEGMGWLFFGNGILITFEDQKQPPARSARRPPAAAGRLFAGGQLK